MTTLELENDVDSVVGGVIWLLLISLSNLNDLLQIFSSNAV